MTEKTKDGADVSLGPACLVIGIFGLVGLSLFFVYMSIMLMGNQGKRAAMSVHEQLIPWIERSLLGQNDRQVIIDRLETLAKEMEREELTSRQLTRLALRLTESTILQWGVVEQLNQIAQSSDLNAAEKEEFSKACDRWLHCASTGKLNMKDMEFGTQNVCIKEHPSGRLVPREKIDADRLREFMRRITTMCDRFEVPKEEFSKSVSQVFLQVIEEALEEK
ncbi:MAG: hypothetical protein KGQ60_19320 [Planctomycetes bacterium]|nr:hypothetical protein [Planctomycetota bacterium]